MKLLCNYIASSILIVCLSGNNTFAATANGPGAQWSAVTVLESGAQLDIRLKNGMRAQGTLSATSETGLTLVEKMKPTSIQRVDIQKLYLVRGRSSLRTMGIGAAVGAGSGALAGLGVASMPFAPSKRKSVLVTAALGASIGTIIGLVISRLRHTRLLIYESV